VPIRDELPFSAGDNSIRFSLTMKIWLAFLAAALSLGAADFTGNWIGTVQIPTGV